MSLKFRKKPVVIEAFQLTAVSRKDNREWPNWLNEAWQKPRTAVGSVSPMISTAEDPALVINTLEGGHRADIGDWIIRGVAGELYPCKPAIFDLTYEAVDGAREKLKK